MSPKFDPLEEAKITDDKSDDKGLKAKKKRAAAAAPPAPPAPPTPSMSAPAPVAAAAEKPALDHTQKYRVLEDKMVSVRGNMTTLRKGKILEARFYGGPILFQRILDSGVKVEEC